MGEAPRAIEEYSEAVEQADTIAADCDLRTLRAVYGQMTNVFHQQNFPYGAACPAGHLHQGRAKGDD